MAVTDPQRRPDHILATIAATAVQALILYALIAGLGFRVADRQDETLTLIDLAEPPPPPPAEKVTASAPEAASERPSGAVPSPVSAPKPVIAMEVPSPLRTSPDPSPNPRVSDGARTAGTSAGAGSGGTGSGGGGIAVRAQRIRGALRNSDYPRSALRSGAEGTVFVRFTVAPDGGVGRCAVTRSSGHIDLDAATCRLIERRFRYRPARDAQGRPVPEVIGLSYEWGLRR